MAQRAIEWLLSLPRVISDGVGMVGTSKGGEMAILTSIICPLVSTVIYFKIVFVIIFLNAELLYYIFILYYLMILLF